MVGARLSISPPRSNGQPPTLRPSHPISRARKISSQQASRTLISKYFYSNPCIACTCKPKPPPTLAKASQYRCRYIQSLADTLLFFFFAPITTPRIAPTTFASLQPHTYTDPYTLRYTLHTKKQHHEGYQLKIFAAVEADGRLSRSKEEEKQTAHLLPPWSHTDVCPCVPPDPVQTSLGDNNLKSLALPDSRGTLANRVLKGTWL